ncbi:MAG: PorT family protein [Bacteroidota bacterium]|nr:PorT family protein [Bacteroidota bacterium]
MKKVFLLLVAFPLIAVIGRAQETTTDVEERVRFGIKASPNLCWTRSDTKGLESSGTRLGYSVGLLAEFPIGVTGNYRFATGIYLTTIGGKTESSTTINVVDSIDMPPREVSVLDRRTMYLRFVELPLTIKLMTNEIGYIRYYGQLGVIGGANLRARADYETISTSNNVVTTVSDTEINIQDDIRAIRASLVIGAGMEYNFSGQTALLAGFTYNSSIINLLEKDAIVGFDRPKLFADYLELTLGVFF